MSVIKETSLKKIEPSPPAIQGHSRSSEPTRIDKRAIKYYKY